MYTMHTMYAMHRFFYVGCHLQYFFKLKTIFSEIRLKIELSVNLQTEIIDLVV